MMWVISRSWNEFSSLSQVVHTLIRNIATLIWQGGRELFASIIIILAGAEYRFRSSVFLEAILALLLST